MVRNKLVVVKQGDYQNALDSALSAGWTVAFANVVPGIRGTNGGPSFVAQTQIPGEVHYVLERFDESD